MSLLSRRPRFRWMATMSEQSFVFQVDGHACVWVTVQAEDAVSAEVAVRAGEGEGWAEVEFEPRDLEVVLAMEGDDA